jgi:hypothetical protein
MAGCNQLSADNFDPTASSWDHSSCYYVLKVLGWCLLFKDPEMEDKSFTLSYSEEAKNWVFFHDFVPDFYINTRDKLYNVKDQNFYVHNEGAYGSYHQDNSQDELITKPFFIDIVFKADEELTLESVNWVSSVLDDKQDLSPVGNEWNTLTHISIWNSQQHTGRIALKDVFKDLQYETSRNLNGKWSFNDFRNVVTTRGTQFIKDLFNDYTVDSSMVSDKVWYEKELLQDKYMIVRFEFDNSQQKQLLLHETSIQAIKSKR